MSDITNWLGERNLAKEIIANNIASLATQLSQNQNKILPGKVIVYYCIPESFGLPSVYKFFYRPKRKHHHPSEIAFFQIFTSVMGYHKQHRVANDSYHRIKTKYSLET